MADTPRSPARQLKQRLDSLKAAGVEFVPKAPPVAVSAGGGSLFAEVEAAPIPADDRRIGLRTLADEIAGCTRCAELYSTRTQTVFGVGPDHPELCFVGEAPGAEEDRQGEPFVGAAGLLLNKIISAMGFAREDVYICNTLKCRPPGNATPTADWLNNCRGYFDRQLDLLRPKFLCCLGGVAAKHVLQTSTGITRLRGTVHRYRDIPVVCTWHPAYILRQQGPGLQKAKAECWDDMKMLLREMGRPVPGAKG